MRADAAARGTQPQPTRLVLETRLAPPMHSRDPVRRARLIELLRRSDRARLTLIHAPAGYGKSTLAAQWREVLAAEGRRVAWLSIDGDEDVGSFLAHVVTAVQRVDPGLAGDLAAVLDQQGGAAHRYVLTSLINAVHEADAPVTLIIDDWHRVTRADTVGALEYLIDNSGPRWRVVVASRSRSGLPLSRTLMRGELCEIDATHLRFDTDESRSLLAGLGGLRLAENAVAALARSTDGWVAALQLAALSLRGNDSGTSDAAPSDLETVLDDLAGGHHAIGEFLADNVVDALDPDLLDFLLATSVTERTCGELANALSGRSDGQAMLEEIEKRDLFLDRLDGRRTWFRFHHLFAGFLRRRLDRDRSRRLHRIAAEWFADHDLINEALDHALAVADLPWAADLVERSAMTLIEHSRMAAVLRLVGRLPAEVVDGRPRLLMAAAWANCLLQRAAPAQLALDRLRHRIAIEGNGESDGGGAAAELLCEADVVQACIDVFADRIDRADALVAPAIERCAQNREFVVAVAANIRTVVDVRNAAFDRAREVQAWARTFQGRTVGQFPGVYGRCLAGLAAYAELDLPTAGEHFRDAMTLARDSSGAHSHAAQLAGALLAELEYERGDLDAAERLLTESSKLGAEGGLAEFMIATYGVLARIRALRGARGEAMDLLTEGTAVAERLHLPRLRAQMIYERVRLLIRNGTPAQARMLLPALPDGSGSSGGVAEAVDRTRTLTVAAVASAEGRHDTAISALTALLDHTTAHHRPQAEILVRIHLAVAQHRGARTNQAVRTLAPALRAGSRAGLRRSFLDADPALQAVLARHEELLAHRAWPDAVDPAPSDYVAALIDRGGRSHPSGVLSPQLRALSAREIDILRLVGLGRSNQRIADELFLTVNTVKWHLKNINSKLGVANRTESVAVVRQAGLLD